MVKKGNRNSTAKGRKEKEDKRFGGFKGSGFPRV